MDLNDQFVGRHLVGNPDDERRQSRIGEHGEITKHHDIRIRHGAVVHIDEALGLLDVVATNLEGTAIGVAGRRVIGNQQDSGGASGGGATPRPTLFSAGVGGGPSAAVV